MSEAMREAKRKDDPAQRRAELLGAYARLQDGHRDEMWSDGAPRAHWQALIDALTDTGIDGLEARRQDGARLFREIGVGFAVSGDESHRRWNLDPVPLVIDSTDWAVLEAGLRQRATLLDAIARDLYGPRELLRAGLLPSALLHRTDAWVRAAEGAVGANGAPALQLYAADVVRGDDGVMRVIADRTQSPSGTGFALESRIVTSRLLPNLIRESHVHRLVAFFDALRAQLAAYAPNRKFDPRMVVLSPGSDDSSFFDHAYMASYLGFPLVEGQDLTVRGSRVFLKTVEGLKVLDGIIRRIADLECDALELDPYSARGVPGLLEASRRGQVLLANPIGVGILENPGLVAYLPAMARFLLGEDLLLESTRSWWCGDRAQMAWVVDHLDQLVIKSIERRGHPRFVDARFGPRLSATERDALRAQIAADPEAFVGQEIVARTTAPCFEGGALQPRACSTRCFVVASPDGYRVMRGGFTRVITEQGRTRVAEGVRDGVCKDTWVLAAEDERHLVQWPSLPVAFSFGETRESLPSRAAESLYWIGRHAEALEAGARIARTLARRQFDSRDYGDPSDRATVQLLAQALASTTGVGAREGDEALRVLSDFVFADGPQSLRATLAALRDNANAVRDRWSADTWRIIDGIETDLDTPSRLRFEGLLGVETALTGLIGRLSGFAGLTSESMTHGDGWRFLVAGRRSERALWMARFLASMLVETRSEAIERGALESVLACCESTITHRRRFRAQIAVSTVVDLVMLDESNPRSLIYQLRELGGHLDELPRLGASNGLTADGRATLRALTALRLADAEAVANTVADARRPALDLLLDDVALAMRQVADALNLAYFAHVRQRQLAPDRRD